MLGMYVREGGHREIEWCWMTALPHEEVLWSFANPIMRAELQDGFGKRLVRPTEEERNQTMHPGRPPHNIPPPSPSLHTAWAQIYQIPDTR